MRKIVKIENSSFTDKGTMCKVEFIRVFAVPLPFLGSGFLLYLR